MKFFATLFLALCVSGCSWPLTISRNNQPNYGPDTLLSALSSLQDSAIDKESRKELSTDSTRQIVTFVVNSAKLVKASNTNVAWKQLIGANLVQLRTDLPVTDEAKFRATFDLIQKILEQK